MSYADTCPVLVAAGVTEEQATTAAQQPKPPSPVSPPVPPKPSVEQLRQLLLYFHWYGQSSGYVDGKVYGPWSLDQIAAKTGIECELVHSMWKEFRQYRSEVAVAVGTPAPDPIGDAGKAEEGGG